MTCNPLEVEEAEDHALSAIHSLTFMKLVDGTSSSCEVAADKEDSTSW
jgi:hypothetical protein